MAHAQKPDFVFRRNGLVHLNRRVRQFSRLLAAEVCASAVVMLDTPCSDAVWRVLATHSIRQFPLNFPSRASPSAITFQLDSTLQHGKFFIETHSLFSTSHMCTCTKTPSISCVPCLCIEEGFLRLWQTDKTKTYKDNYKHNCNSAFVGRGTTTTLRHTTVGRTPLDEWSARRRNLYLTTHNTHKTQISMPAAGFEPPIPASEGPKTHALDRAATAIGNC
jgi:hypothetical protein